MDRDLERTIVSPTSSYTQQSKKPKTDYKEVSLLDSVSKRRITLPVYGANCSHPGVCFDRSAFVENKLTVCPICSANVDSQNLIVDKRLEDIINQTADDIMAVKIYEDESWEPITLNEDNFVMEEVCHLPIRSSTPPPASAYDELDSTLDEDEDKDADVEVVERQSQTTNANAGGRIRFVFNKKVRYATLLPSTNFYQLYCLAMRKFPAAVKSNNSLAKLQLFAVQGTVKSEITTNTDVQKLVAGDTIELVATAPTVSTSTVASNLVRWFFWDDDNKWKRYSQSDSDKIEQVYQNGSSDKVSLANGLYTISISGRTQTRPNTGKVRKIVRGTWFWTADSNALVPYDEATAAKLETAYQELSTNTSSGSKNVPIDTNRYCIVKLYSTTQYNRTGTAQGRPVRRGFA